MKNFITKKAIAAFVAGTFICAGLIVPFAVQASADKQDRPAMHQRKVDPNKAAERLAQRFGLSQEAILKHHNAGYNFHDLHKSAFLAKASGKSFESVIAMKTADTNWRSITQELGVTKDQLKLVRRDMRAQHIIGKTKMSKEAVMSLMEQGYKGRDIYMAGLLEMKSGRLASDVIQLKKINNTWFDVAEAIGVDREAWKTELKDQHKNMRHNTKHLWR